jgi:type I restriction enzyme S subunit
MPQQEMVKLPKSWKSLNIGDISIFQNGFAFKSGWFTDSGKFQVIKLGNVKDDYLKLEKSPAFVSLDIANEYMKYKPNVGDILISMTGTKYKGDYGYVCRVNEDLSILINQRVGRIIAKSELIDSDFLHHYMRSELFRIEFLKGETGGVNQGNVGTKHIQSCPIGMPPLPEQKRIVEKLDSLLAQVDTIQQRLNTLPDIIKRFRQSVLAAAVSGKLTPNKKFKTEPLINLVKILNGARKPVSATLRKDMQGEYPYYGATSIVDYVNGWTHDDNLLLVGEDGANLLTKAKDLAFKVSGKIWVNNHAHVLKENENVNLDYIRFAINSMDLSEWVTGSAQPKLTKTALQRLPITIPEFEEQTEIVRLVEQYFALADTLEKHLKNAKQRVDNLTQAILAKAFKGKLVSQDPNDEPADKLIERIKASI